MVHVLSLHNVFPNSWADVTAAIWQKYPNPFAAHVLAADVLEQRVDQETGMLHTTRLFLKRGNLPKWGKHLISAPQAFIIEQSTVDPANKIMTTVTRNLSHVKLMLVEETQTITVDKGNPEHTEVRTDARIVSNTSFVPIRSRIEQFGLSRFKTNAINSAQGLKHVLKELSQKRKGSLF